MRLCAWRLGTSLWHSAALPAGFFEVSTCRQHESASVSIASRADCAADSTAGRLQFVQTAATASRAAVDADTEPFTGHARCAIRPGHGQLVDRCTAPAKPSLVLLVLSSLSCHSIAASLIERLHLLLYTCSRHPPFVHARVSLHRNDAVRFLSVCLCLLTAARVERHSQQQQQQQLLWSAAALLLLLSDHHQLHQ